MNSNLTALGRFVSFFLVLRSGESVAQTWFRQVRESGE